MANRLKQLCPLIPEIAVSPIISLCLAASLHVNVALANDQRLGMDDWGGRQRDGRDTGNDKFAERDHFVCGAKMYQSRKDSTRWEVRAVIFYIHPCDARDWNVQGELPVLGSIGDSATPDTFCPEGYYVNGVLSPHSRFLMCFSPKQTSGSLRSPGADLYPTFWKVRLETCTCRG